MLTPTSVALVLIAGLVDGGQASLIGAGRITPAHDQAPMNGGTVNLNFVPGRSAFLFVTWRP